MEAWTGDRGGVVTKEVIHMRRGEKTACGESFESVTFGSFETVNCARCHRRSKVHLSAGPTTACGRFTSRVSAARGDVTCLTCLGREPTARQRQVLSEVGRLTKEKGYPPTLAELGAALGINSHNGVRDHLISLQRKGMLTWQTGQARTLRVVS